MHITLWLKVSQRVSDKIAHAHVITCLSVRCLFLFCLLPLPLALLLSLSLSTCSLSCSSTSMSWEPPRIKTTALTHNEEYCTVAIHNPLTRLIDSVFRHDAWIDRSSSGRNRRHGCVLWSKPKAKISCVMDQQLDFANARSVPQDGDRARTLSMVIEVSRETQFLPRWTLDTMSSKARMEWAD